MSNNQTDKEVTELVNYKVHKRVAKKVMKDIHQQVDEIEQQAQTEKTASKVLLPLLFLLSATIISMLLFWSDTFRLVSGLIN